MSTQPGHQTDFGANEWLVYEIRQQYLKDPDSVSEAWREFLSDYSPSDAGNGSGSEQAGPAGSTLRHLLAHASGLDAAQRTVRAAPGVRRIYSNAGFEVLAETVADRSGIPFPEYVHEALLLPLSQAAYLQAAVAVGVIFGAAAAGRWLAEQGVSASVVKMNGAVELAPRLRIAPFICDLVSTGATLEANGLKAVETVLESEAVLIRTRKAVPEVKRDSGERLLSRIEGVLGTRDAKYIMLNAPSEALAAISRLLPGAEAPTVLPLHGRPGHFAVHAVCRESVFWETLQQLKSAGASAILVLPIEKMLP